MEMRITEDGALRTLEDGEPRLIEPDQTLQGLVDSAVALLDARRLSEARLSYAADIIASNGALVGAEITVAVRRQ